MRIWRKKLEALLVILILWNGSKILSVIAGRVSARILYGVRGCVAPVVVDRFVYLFNYPIVIRA